MRPRVQVRRGKNRVLRELVKGGDTVAAQQLIGPWGDQYTLKGGSRDGDQKNHNVFTIAEALESRLIGYECPQLVKEN